MTTAVSITVIPLHLDTKKPDDNTAQTFIPGLFSIFSGGIECALVLGGGVLLLYWSCEVDRKGGEGAAASAPASAGSIADVYS